MVRGSELAFRSMIRQYGIQHCYSPMLRASEVVKAYALWEKDFQFKDRIVNVGEGEGRGKGNDFLNKIKHEDGILLVNDICNMIPLKFDQNLPNHNVNDDNEREKGYLTVQLCGCEPEILYDATQILIKLRNSGHMRCDQLVGIDLNLGCPQKCAQTACFGAFLAEKKPGLALECIAAMKRAIDSFRPKESIRPSVSPSPSESASVDCLPRLSCKIRLLDTVEETIKFAQNLQSAGCEILALHCRRRADKHNGKPDLLAGKLVANALSIPVVINGSESTTLQDVAMDLENIQAHSVMIARAFLENPRLFVEPKSDPASLAAEYLNYCEQYPPPSPLYIQKHLRWIFRKYLQPQDELEGKNYDYSDWRLRLWTFLVRPYVKNIYQFRQVVHLYVNLNGSKLPESLRGLPSPSFKSIRHHREQIQNNDR